MAKKSKLTTSDYSLRLTKELNNIVNIEFNNGTYFSKVSETTKSLLHYWFDEERYYERNINFHKGQKQAILNAIYCYEVLQTKNVYDLYDKMLDIADCDFINDNNFLNYIRNIEEYNYNKYCIKMATGTGKTFVMNALLIWQYLNYYYKQPNMKFNNNFLFIAPGNIVYDRLLDAFLGKQNDDGLRNFDTSDIKKNEDLFLPNEYRQIFYNFIQNSVVNKEEISKRIVGDGIIAISNWQYLNDFEKEEVENINEEEILDFNDENFINNVLNEFGKIVPSKDKGADLNVLDNVFNIGKTISYLSELDNICIFNDEAHHIHNNKSKDVMIWQRIINKILENKKNNCLQLDFSATPYENISINIDNDMEKNKNYFPYIITNFSLIDAIKNKIVKIPAIEMRETSSSIKNEDLNFKAEKDGNKTISLSDGQRLMLNTGLTKLSILEKSFFELTKNDKKIKYPKMLVMCEDTSVSPLVVEFLKDKGLNDDDILRIDSNKKGEIKDDEWDTIKFKLNNVDKNKMPRVIVSVLMLREGFDVNNICVIVPLRASNSGILIEQIIGRGLRLMWRESEYNDYKDENLQNMMEHKQVSNFFDILSIVEHPNYIHLYESLKDCIINDNIDIYNSKTLVGDMIKIGLKDNYKDYDLFWPIIVCDKEEEIKDCYIDYKNIESFKSWSINQLRNRIDKCENITSNEVIQKTRLCEYKVDINLFNSKCYNEYLSKLVNILLKNSEKAKNKVFPILQVNKVNLTYLLDNYIQHKIFDCDFNPFEDNNWKILMINEVIKHIITEFANIVLQMNEMENVSNAIIKKRYFSELQELKIRNNYSLNVNKCIYNKLAYPSNKGGFERNFIIECNNDVDVEAFIKIKERAFNFINLKYIKNNGFISSYYPDFIVKTKDYIFIVETKAEKDITNVDVKRKAVSALNFMKSINELKSEDRDDRVWYYVLLNDETFDNELKYNTPFCKILLNNVLTENFYKIQNEFSFI